MMMRTIKTYSKGAPFYNAFTRHLRARGTRRRFPGDIITPVMPIVSGTKLGPYEIQSPPGAGRMGEVYRANDERLAHDVAITVLPDG